MNIKNIQAVFFPLIFFFILSTPSLGIVPVQRVKETHIQVNVDIILLGERGTSKIAELSADIPAGKKGFLIKTVEMESDSTREEVIIELELLPDTKNRETITLDIESRVKHPEAAETPEYMRNTRLEFNEGSSSFLEIYTSQKTGKKIILNLSGIIEEVETFKPSYPSTTKVLFQLNIFRISMGKEILLEQNSLSTVLGQAASYYLHLYAEEKVKKGEKPAEDELDIRMTPLSIADEVAEVEIVIEGRILKSGGKENVVNVREVEKIANSSSHSVVVAIEESHGVAQEGYMFEIIPSF